MPATERNFGPGRNGASVPPTGPFRQWDVGQAERASEEPLRRVAAGAVRAGSQLCSTTNAASNSALGVAQASLVSCSTTPARDRGKGTQRTYHLMVAVLVVQWGCTYVRTVMAGWLYGFLKSACCLVPPRCGFSLSLFCNHGHVIASQGQHAAAALHSDVLMCAETGARSLQIQGHGGGGGWRKGGWEWG